MNEILFRGQRVDNNEWVYGYYFKTPLTVENFEAGFLGDKERYCISDEEGVVYEVMPKTVGQFTGLYDNNDDTNGVKIFEGDIIKNFLCTYAEKFRYEVVGDILGEGWLSYYGNTSAENDSDYPSEYDKIIVVSNIHDSTPEQLKEWGIKL